MNILSKVNAFIVFLYSGCFRCDFELSTYENKLSTKQRNKQKKIEHLLLKRLPQFPLQ